ncbi:MAG TPA: hypothetical protein V6D13_12515 [Halomicronema sp.]
MISYLRAIGKLMVTDEEGFLVNDCDQNKILPPWKNLVEELCQTCSNAWKTRLLGLYLRGSVPRGFAIPRVSDLDSMVILTGEISSDDWDLVKKICKGLERRFIFCKKVEIIIISEKELKQNYSPWQGIIKTQSLWLLGHDFQTVFPNFKPGLALISHCFDLELDLNKALKNLENLSSLQLSFNREVKKNCAWICRRLIRSGFELVMEADQSYTRDLYLCYERFSFYFPQHQWLMKKTLELALEPSEDRAGLIVFLRLFGGELVNLVKHQFPSEVLGSASTNNIP